MSEQILKNRLALSIFFGQVGLVILVLFSPFYGVDFPDAMSLLTVVGPILGAYSVVIVKAVVRERHIVRSKGRPVSNAFVVIAFAVPVVLFISVAGIFLCYALDFWNVSVEETRFALTSLEALFGIYLGLVVDALFGNEGKAQAQKQKTSNTGVQADV